MNTSLSVERTHLNNHPQGVWNRQNTSLIYFPETFSSSGSWTRGIYYNQAKIMVRLLNNGEIEWTTNDSALDRAQVNQLIKRMFDDVDLPQSIRLGQVFPHNYVAFLPLTHVRSANLFEAISRAVLRQVVKATQAKKLIQVFCTEIGGYVTWEDTRCYFFPHYRDVKCLNEERLREIGMGYKSKVIRSIANEIEAIEADLQIASNDTTAILSILKNIKGIGDWSARIVLSDYWGEWDHYPFDDLAVRTLAKRHMPQHPWELEPTLFKEQWKKVHGADVGKITFYTLSSL